MAFGYAGLMIMAVSGVVVNFVILYKFNTEYLGLFNIGFAFYITLAQLGTGGVQFSLLYFVAKNKKNIKLSRSLLSQGIYLVILYGSSVSIAWYLSSKYIAELIRQPALISAFKLLAPALMLYTLNKVLIAFSNSLKRMKTVALTQMVRYLSLMSFVVVSCYYKMPIDITFYCFLLTEISVLLVQIFFLYEHLFHLGLPKILEIKKIASYGIKALSTGTLLELNTRIDVLILSYFVSSTQVGLYSFVATIAEGLTWLLAILRNQINPYLVTYIAENSWLRVKQLLQLSRRYLYLGAFSIFLLLNVIYPLVIEIILPGRGLLAAYPLLIILTFSFVLLAGYMPFDQILSMGGHPGYQSIQTLTVVASNLILNFALVPRFGIYGAALAFLLANSVIAIMMLKYWVKKSFGSQVSL